ncbi:hypothetical protein LUZ61_007460 [Rhynchospora tenuis]|uniref:Uncharacterized protein n=1 Tax=Rhynchospora tenuis TaxID=198213 RepID=A0AAD5ZTG9_9POAL|nr:hypothetical protein LUZ61_007460 [Rhynchospora tenuis]
MVEVIESSFVVPSDETPKGRLWLSNLDQVAQSAFVGTVYFYKKTEATNFFSVEVLKDALSKALVLFYPLAGRHVVGSDGRVELDCNAKGCFFVIARLECTFDSINFQPLSELKHLFVPNIKMAGSPFVMLMIQVTYLKCGGVVLGFAFNHVFGDARGSFHFIQTWASITRGDLSSIIPPSFDQTPLRARSPPIVKFDHTEYTGETITRPALTSIMTTKFRLSKDQVRTLKSRCSEVNFTKISSFCVIVSLVWKCYCVAQGLDPDSTSHIIFLVDIRDRLKPPLPRHHFSNAIVWRSLQSKVSKITSNPLRNVAESVRSAVDSVNDEYVRSLIDYLEIMKNEVFAKKQVPESHLRVVSISRMPVYDSDFGWGAPYFASRWDVDENRTVYINNESGESGGLEVVVTLDSATMHCFEKLFNEELNTDNKNSSSIGPKNHIGQSKL